MELLSFPSLASLNTAVAEELSRLAKESIASSGRFSVALSGGNTPQTLYETLAKEYSEKIDWNHVHLFWGDERFVPQGDPASNYRMVKEALLDQIGIPSKNIHPVPISTNASDSAEAYSQELRAFFQEDIPSFDLILLGLGGDGHTASLFPGMTVKQMNEGIAIVTHSPIAPDIRISLTLSLINNARNIFVLVSGEGKREILKSVLTARGDSIPKYPASCVNPKGRLVWFTDEEARNRDRMPAPVK